MNPDQWSQIVAKAWADDKFKKRLLADPAAVLKENGIPVPPGVTIRVVENSDNVVNLTLPAKVEGELADDELERIAAGAAWICPDTEPYTRRAAR